MDPAVDDNVMNTTEKIELPVPLDTRLGLSVPLGTCAREELSTRLDARAELSNLLGASV